MLKRLQLSGAISFLFFILTIAAFAQSRGSFTKPAKRKIKGGVQVIPMPAERKVEVLIDGKLFTCYQYPGSIMKPVLWPIKSQNGTDITRGFPLVPRPGERVDHPHHVGLWFNHGNVNGHDFWNNSLQIGKEHAGPFGRIVHQTIDTYHNGSREGDLVVTCAWLGQNGDVFLQEKTKFTFGKSAQGLYIIRTSFLTAGKDSVRFRDNKEGLMGLRVARFLEHPSNKPEQFVDAKGQITPVPVLSNEGVTGNYKNSEGLKGDQVWGKRAKWVNLSGFSGKDSLGVLIFDHPGNPGYPSHWHARGYGLFSSNGLGAHVFSEGKETLNFVLPPGKTACFTYKILVWEGKAPKKSIIEKMEQNWGSFNPLADDGGSKMN